MPWPAGKLFSEIHRLRISKALRGKPKSEEHRKSMREVVYQRGVKPGYKQSLETRLRRSAALKGRKCGPGNKGWHHTPETRKKMSRSAALRMRNTKTEGTSIEIAVGEVLSSLELYHVPQELIRNYVVDFLLPDWNLVVECDGDFWHGRPGKRETDEKRDLELRSLGYEVVRLPESQIKKDPKQVVVAGLLEAVW